MLRQTLIIALATLGCLSMAQEQSAKFSFKAPAGPAKRVFEELSKAAGTSLVAGGLLGNDVILLNLSDVTLNEAMDKIASTLHAEWRKEASGWVLYRGPNFEAADQRAEIAARVAEFRTNLNRVLEDQKKAGAFTSDSAKKMVDAQNKMNEDAMRQSGSGGPIRLTGVAGLGQQGPAARAIANLLSRMSDAQVATLTNGMRNVFSLNPTRMQIPMPNGSNQILQQFIRDCQTLKDMTARNEQPQEQGVSRRLVINGFGSDGMGDGDPRLGIGYAVLINQPNLGGNNSVSLSLLVADPNGKTIASGQFFVGGFSQRNTANEQKAPTNEKPIELSELSKELLKAMNMTSAGGSGNVRTGVRMISVASGSGGGTFSIAGGGDGKTPTLSAELKERVLNPEKYDPMSFAPGEAFSFVADAKGQDLVAYLPDTAFNTLSQVASGSITPSAFLKAVQIQLNIKEEGGWLLASPKAPASARENRVNRQALGNALRLLNSKGYLSLDDWATFATNQRKAPRFNEFDDSYFRLINAPAADAGLGQLGFGGGWQMLQFYGSMSTMQKQALSRSDRVALNSLNQTQLALVHDQVYNSFDGPMVMNPQNPNSGFMEFSFGGAQGVDKERTFVLPNGVPRDGFLQFTLRQTDTVQANSTTSGGGRFMTAEGLAFERMRAEKPELANFGPTTQYDQFRMASQRTVAFQFQFGPGITLNRQLEDNTPGNQQFGSFDRLPADFKKRIDQMTEQLKKTWGGISGGGGPGQVPPPR